MYVLKAIHADWLGPSTGRGVLSVQRGGPASRSTLRIVPAVVVPLTGESV